MNNKPRTTWIVTTVIALFAIVAGTYYSIRPKPQAENSNASADASLTFNTPSLNSNINTTLSPKLTINPTTNQVTAVEVHLSFDPTKMAINSITNSGTFAKTLKEPEINNTQGTASFIYGINVTSNSTPVTVTSVSDVATINLTTKGVVGDATLSVLNTSIATAKDVDTSVLGTFGQMTIHVLSSTVPTPSPSPAASVGKIKFAAVGDFGDGLADEASVANLIKSWNPEFIITVGDNNYEDGAASTIDKNIGKDYHSFIGNYVGSYGAGASTNKFFPTLGNHDWDTSGAQPYLNYFTLPNNERYYDFVKGDVHFFAIDSDPNEPDGTTPNSVQGQWLKNKLAQSTSKWNLVYFHHAPYTSGNDHGSTVEMQWPFATWGADVVMSGHEHLYERLIEDGIPYFVNGSGGHGLYDFGSPISGSQVRYADDFGAMLIEADSNSMNFKFINKSGTVIDNYTLVSDFVTPTATPATYLDWDVNMDSKINIVDIGLVVDNYDSDRPTTSRADVNNDGTINVVDIGIVVDNYQW